MTAGMQDIVLLLFPLPPPLFAYMSEQMCSYIGLATLRSLYCVEIQCYIQNYIFRCNRMHFSFKMCVSGTRKSEPIVRQFFKHLAIVFANYKWCKKIWLGISDSSQNTWYLWLLFISIDLYFIVMSLPISLTLHLRLIDLYELEH